MSNTALLLIDLQNDYFPTFEGAKWPLVNTENAAAQGAKLLGFFREKGLPVVHVRHENPTTEAPFFHPDSEGAQIHVSVLPVEGEPVVVKQMPNSFAGTNLKEILDGLDVTNLVIAGAMSNMCIDAGTRAAVDFGYNCSVAQDACAAMNLEHAGVSVPAEQVHAAFMAALALGIANVASTDDILTALI